MRDTQTPFLVPSIRQRKVNLATLHEVSPADIRDAVPEMLALTDGEIDNLAFAARQQFGWNNQDFKELFIPFLYDDPSPVRQIKHPPKARIAIFGNFRPEHSTENDLRWTLEDMGYGVDAFQEDEVRTEQVLGDCRQFHVKLLIYVHTHGWTTPGRISLDDLWRELKADGIKTCSFHLDRYWGLNELDQRENLIGQHPFWHTETVFTADGGQHQWAERGVHHVWLPPAIAAKNCATAHFGFGIVKSHRMSTVAFVGATSYHPEYPFREELINFLRQTYGEEFRVFQGYRGQDLKDLYRNVSVVVGDSCFGGADFYYSDRVPETLGRGGFLIHPETKGLRIPGLVTFEPGNLAELKSKIDYFLFNSAERGKLADTACQWVQDFETYHNRMSVLLETMGVS